jgi:hypothetical protein
MKKLISLLVFVVALSSTPVFASQATSAITGQEAKTEAALIISRIHEIQKIDKKQLTFKEKEALKVELTGIKKKISQPGVAVYISGTTLLIIIILLVIFL